MDFDVFQSKLDSYTGFQSIDVPCKRACALLSSYVLLVAKVFRNICILLQRAKSTYCENRANVDFNSCM